MKSASPPHPHQPPPCPFKKTCPCTILPPFFFFNCSYSPSSSRGHQNLLPPPLFKKKGWGRGPKYVHSSLLTFLPLYFNHYILDFILKFYCALPLLVFKSLGRISFCTSQWQNKSIKWTILHCFFPIFQKKIIFPLLKYH